MSKLKHREMERKTAEEAQSKNDDVQPVHCITLRGSIKLEMTLDDEIGSSTAELENSVVSGQMRSKFAVSYCIFCSKSKITFGSIKNRILTWWRAFRS